MKKIISTLLCAVIAFSAVVTANAATTETEVEAHKGFEDLGESFVLPDNIIRMHSTVKVDVSTLAKAYVIQSLDRKESYYLYYNEGFEQYKDTLFEPKEYFFFSGRTMDMARTGGLYKKIKIKLSEFNKCFDEEGKYYVKIFDNAFDYNYNETDDGYNASAFTFISGGYFQRMKPDENGEIEAYVCTNIGIRPSAHMQCSESEGKIQAAGEFMEYFDKLTFGNVDCNKYVDVNDVTAIQMYIAGIKKLDTLGVFHADTNCDGIYDVKDVTHLQLAIASLKSLSNKK